MYKKRYQIYPKSFIGKISFYLFGFLLISFLAVLIFTDTKREWTIGVVSFFLVAYIFANIKFFKVEIEGDKVYLPKDKIAFDDKDSNLYYYKDNITDLGDELETPYFVFSKNNVKKITIIHDKDVVKDAQNNFPEMFYASNPKKNVCVEFKEPLTFEIYNSNDDNEIDESIKTIEKIYLSVIKAEEFLKEFEK